MSLKAKLILGFGLALFIVLASLLVYKLKTTDFVNPDLSYEPEIVRSATVKPAEPKVLQPKLLVPILVYHHIRDFNDSKQLMATRLSVSPEKFKEQLDWLIVNGYHAITFTTLKSGKLPTKPIILTFDDGYQNFFDSAYPELKSRKMKAVMYIISEARGKAYLTHKEIKELADNGIEIGAHTLHHPYLDKLSFEDAKKEIFDSKAELEKLIGQQIISFAYPYSRYNDAVVQLVKEAGFDFSLTMHQGTADFHNNDLLVLPRWPVYHETNLKSFLK